MDWFQPDLEAYYGLVGRFEEDVTLVGSGTLVQSPDAETLSRDPGEVPVPGAPDPSDDRPILAVPDSGDKVKNWAYLRTLPYWRDIFALSSSDASPEQIERFRRQHIPYFLSGRGRVDLAAALTSIAGRFGAKVVRVDSGGTLNGALLRAGLVDEISLLLHPQYVGGCSPRTLFRAEDLTSAEGVIRLELAGNETLSGGLVWLRYNVLGPKSSACAGD
jgi:2,5-diamino-6-(ribosylamino)-4(3H)-pyrimidinone 5'-phosphate reductase